MNGWTDKMLNSSLWNRCFRALRRQRIHVYLGNLLMESWSSGLKIRLFDFTLAHLGNEPRVQNGAKQQQNWTVECSLKRCESIFRMRFLPWKKSDSVEWVQVFLLCKVHCVAQSRCQSCRSVLLNNYYLLRASVCSKKAGTKSVAAIIILVQVSAMPDSTLTFECSWLIAHLFTWLCSV